MALDESNIEATRIALSGAGPIPNAVLYNNAKDLAAAMKAAGVTFGGTSDPLPIGSVVAYSGATIPTGYLDADGSSQLRASYPDLFAAIGTTYGPGALPGTTFALPNFVGTYTNFIIKATAAAASTTVISETLIAVPLGSLQLYAGSVYPTGWLRADGTAISRTTYAGLFAIIGTTYGAGDGSTTFNLPNLSSSGVPSPVYIIKVTLSGSVEPSTVAHASSHIRAGTDVIDGDRVQIDYVPSAYTRNAAAPGAGAVTDLTAHLAGINALSGQGHIICSSLSRPAFPATGTMIYDTDIERLLLYSGISWVIIPTANDEAYGQYLYDGAGLVAATGNTKVPFSNLLFSKNLTLSSGSMIFAKPGIYEFSVGHRFGTGADTWTGVNLFNATTSTVLAKAYGTGQVGGADPGPVSYQFLGQITSTTQSHDIRIYRDSGSLTLLDPVDNAGYQITCTVKRLSSS
jgi:microcystin-dependent protein